MNTSADKNLSIMLGILEDAGYFLWYDCGVWFFSLEEDSQSEDISPVLNLIAGTDKGKVITWAFQELAN